MSTVRYASSGYMARLACTIASLSSASCVKRCSPGSTRMCAISSKLRPVRQLQIGRVQQLGHVGEGARVLVVRVEQNHVAVRVLGQDRAQDHGDRATPACRWCRARRNACPAGCRSRRRRAPSDCGAAGRCARWRCAVGRRPWPDRGSSPWSPARPAADSGTRRAGSPRPPHPVPWSDLAQGLDLEHRALALAAAVALAAQRVDYAEHARSGRATRPARPCAPPTLRCCPRRRTASPTAPGRGCRPPADGSRQCRRFRRSARRRPDCRTRTTVQGQRRSALFTHQLGGAGSVWGRCRWYGCRPVPRRADWVLRARRSGRRRHPSRAPGTGRQHRRRARRRRRDGAQGVARSLQRRRGQGFAVRRRLPAGSSAAARARRARRGAPAALAERAGSTADARSPAPLRPNGCAGVLESDRIACHATAVGHGGC